MKVCTRGTVFSPRIQRSQDHLDRVSIQESNGSKPWQQQVSKRGLREGSQVRRPRCLWSPWRGMLVCLRDQPKDERPGMTVCLVGLSADCARKAKNSPSFAIANRTHRQSGMWLRCARNISTEAAKRLSRRSFEQLWRSVRLADLPPVIHILHFHSLARPCRQCVSSNLPLQRNQNVDAMKSSRHRLHEEIKGGRREST